MKYEINLMGFQRFDLGTLFDKPKFVTSDDGIYNRQVFPKVLFSVFSIIIFIHCGH